MTVPWCHIVGLETPIILNKRTLVFLKYCVLTGMKFLKIPKPELMLGLSGSNSVWAPRWGALRALTPLKYSMHFV